jgi:hypothetical protein
MRRSDMENVGWFFVQNNEGCDIKTFQFGKEVVLLTNVPKNLAEKIVLSVCAKPRLMGALYLVLNRDAMGQRLTKEDKQLILERMKEAEGLE